MDLQSKEVIEAAKSRLAVATKSEISTSQMLGSATINLEMAIKMLGSSAETARTAKKNHEDAKKEKVEAELSFKGVEESFEVIDVDHPGRVPSAELTNVSIESGALDDENDFFVVEGCGIQETNGTCKKYGYMEDAPMYWKDGTWKRKSVRFMLLKF